LATMSPDSQMKQAIVHCMTKAAKPLVEIGRLYIWVIKQGYALYNRLPTNVIEMLIGIGLCFFGGAYFTSIAALEAAHSFGGKRMVENLQALHEQGGLAVTASLEDDEVDADNDGTADVEQMTANELVQHKAKVCMVAIRDPERLSDALQSLFTAYLAVIATLKFQFAKTVALALGIADMLSFVCVRAFGPVLAMALGPDLNHWVNPMIRPL